MEIQVNKDSFIASLQLGVKVKKKRNTEISDTTELVQTENDEKFEVSGIGLNNIVPSVMDALNNPSVEEERELVSEETGFDDSVFPKYLEHDSDDYPNSIEGADEDDIDTLLSPVDSEEIYEDEFDMDSDDDEEDSEDDEFNMGSDDDEDSEDDEFDMDSDDEDSDEDSEDEEFDMDSDEEEEPFFEDDDGVLESDLQEEIADEFHFDLNSEEDDEELGDTEDEFNMESDDDEDDEFELDSEEQEEIADEFHFDFDSEDDEENEEFDLDSEDEDEEFNMDSDDEETEEAVTLTDSFTPPTLSSVGNIPQVSHVNVAPTVTPAQPTAQAVTGVQTVEDAIKDPNIVYEKGMSVADFVRANGLQIEKKVALQHFNAAEINKALDYGRVLAKGSKLLV